MDLRGKRVVVIGLGTSGIAACRLLRARGANVVGTDAKEPEAAKALAAEGIDVVLGGHEGAKVTEAELVVVSPGVPPIREIADAEAKKIPIWGEVELATRLMAHPALIVAIGGTNGKSTVTSLVGALLQRAGKRVFVGGNLGEPLAAHADETFDVVVLEVSSFQMERVDAFKPYVSVLLNVTPDHLDRYPSIDAYARAKGNAFVKQDHGDVAVVPFDDAVCIGEAQRGKARMLTFGPGGDVDVLDHAIIDKTAHPSPIAYDRARIYLQGGHNALNVAAALAAVSAFELNPRDVAEVLCSFRGLPHRMALVRKLAGVTYYDDSKGTNVGATVTAVRGITQAKVVLVAGGRDKGGSYVPLVDALKERGRAAVLIGEAADAIEKAIGSTLPTKRAGSMDEAVAFASALAKPGDAVLLSPACSSFDMFRDYKHRGDEFVRAVMALPGESQP